MGLYVCILEGCCNLVMRLLVGQAQLDLYLQQAHHVLLDQTCTA